MKSFQIRGGIANEFLLDGQIKGSKRFSGSALDKLLRSDIPKRNLKIVLVMRLRSRWSCGSFPPILSTCARQGRLAPFLRYHPSWIRFQTTLPPPNYLPLSHFIPSTLPDSPLPADPAPYLANSIPQTYYIERYGCQMNVADADLINAILQSHNYRPSSSADSADIVLLVTCAIRSKAEDKIWRRLECLQSIREKGGKIAVLGCMAERLKFQLLEGKRMVDVVCGPDAYRDLPSLLARSEGEGVGNVMLSVDETYADILPVQIDSGKVSAYLSIMRGCNNMCTYCIVPFTRGTMYSE
jgi:Uncharacterized protein family UPF0004